MINFEEMQKNWQSQPVNQLPDLRTAEKEMETDWTKYQRKLLYTNRVMSICFLLTAIGLAWVYFTYRADFNWPFDVSIGSTYLLMFCYLGAVWKSYAFKKENLDTSSITYIGYQLKKLNWQRKTITLYSWIYTLLLWLALVLYTWEITARGTPLFRFTALSVFTVYIFIVNYWFRLKKQKKQLSVIDQISRELAQLREGLNGG